MNNNRKVIAALAVLIAVAISFGLLYCNFKLKPSEGEKSFTVKVVHSNLSENIFSYTSSDAYLGDILLREGLIKGEKGSYGIYITEVDGEQAIYEKDKAYWALFVNGEYAVTGIDATPINNGDEFSLVYTVG